MIELNEFMDKVSRRGHRGCWLWEGYSREESGRRRGYVKCGGKYVLVHRVSWMLTNGDIPDKMCVCHRCDNPLCVNPDHLFLATQRDNLRDCLKKGRCKFGRWMKDGCLTEEEVRRIRKVRKEGWLYREIAEEFDISEQNVSDICLRKTWVYVE